MGPRLYMKSCFVNVLVAQAQYFTHFNLQQPWKESILEEVSFQQAYFSSIFFIIGYYLLRTMDRSVIGEPRYMHANYF
jgi:hypothetical protein